MPYNSHVHYYTEGSIVSKKSIMTMNDDKFFSSSQAFYQFSILASESMIHTSLTVYDEGWGLVKNRQSVKT